MGSPEDSFRSGKSSLSPRRSRSRPCPFFARGRCRRSACEFLHSGEQPSPQGDSTNGSTRVTPRPMLREDSDVDTVVSGFLQEEELMKNGHLGDSSSSTELSESSSEGEKALEAAIWLSNWEKRRISGGGSANNDPHAAGPSRVGRDRKGSSSSEEEDTNGGQSNNRRRSRSSGLRRTQRRLADRRSKVLDNSSSTDESPNEEGPIDRSVVSSPNRPLGPRRRNRFQRAKKRPKPDSSSDDDDTIDLVNSSSTPRSSPRKSRNKDGSQCVLGESSSASRSSHGKTLIKKPTGHSKLSQKVVEAPKRSKRLSDKKMVIILDSSDEKSGGAFKCSSSNNNKKGPKKEEESKKGVEQRSVRSRRNAQPVYRESSLSSAEEEPHEKKASSEKEPSGAKESGPSEAKEPDTSEAKDPSSLIRKTKLRVGRPSKEPKPASPAQPEAPSTLKRRVGRPSKERNPSPPPCQPEKASPLPKRRVGRPSKESKTSEAPQRPLSTAVSDEGPNLPEFDPKKFKPDYTPQIVEHKGVEYAIVVTGVKDTGLCGTYWGAPGQLPHRRGGKRKLEKEDLEICQNPPSKKHKGSSERRSASAERICGSVNNVNTNKKTRSKSLEPVKKSKLKESSGSRSVSADPISSLKEDARNDKQSCCNLEQPKTRSQIINKRRSSGSRSAVSPDRICSPKESVDKEQRSSSLEPQTTPIENDTEGESRSLSPERICSSEDVSKNREEESTDVPPIQIPAPRRSSRRRSQEELPHKKEEGVPDSSKNKGLLKIFGPPKRGGLKKVSFVENKETADSMVGLDVSEAMNSSEEHLALSDSSVEMSPPTLEGEEAVSSSCDSPKKDDFCFKIPPAPPPLKDPPASPKYNDHAYSLPSGENGSNSEKGSQEESSNAQQHDDCNGKIIDSDSTNGEPSSASGTTVVDSSKGSSQINGESETTVVDSSDDSNESSIYNGIPAGDVEESPPPINDQSTELEHSLSNLSVSDDRRQEEDVVSTTIPHQNNESSAQSEESPRTEASESHESAQTEEGTESAAGTSSSSSVEAPLTQRPTFLQPYDSLTWESGYSSQISISEAPYPNIPEGVSLRYLRLRGRSGGIPLSPQTSQRMFVLLEGSLLIKLDSGAPFEVHKGDSFSVRPLGQLTLINEKVREAELTVFSF